MLLKYKLDIIFFAMRDAEPELQRKWIVQDANSATGHWKSNIFYQKVTIGIWTSNKILKIKLIIFFSLKLSQKGLILYLSLHFNGCFNCILS